VLRHLPSTPSTGDGPRGSSEEERKIRLGANLSVWVIKNKKRKGKDGKWRETPVLKKFVYSMSIFESH